MVFQSTRPRGARHARGRAAARTIEFQSTRPRGARLGLNFGITDKASFQSTRPRGARPEAVNQSSLLSLSFNPRAREGRDPSPAVK